jgi:hypothetical protein
VVLVLMDAVVMTDYGQFTVTQTSMWDGDADRFFAGQVNGWVAAAVPGVVHVVMARRSGGSGVRVELWEREPSPSDWDDVVEVSAAFRDGDAVLWEGWGGMSGGGLALPAGSYRVRVSAQGRDAGNADEFAEGVVDRYLLQFWPAPAAPDEVLRTLSTDAEYWNGAWGQRR